MGYLYEPQRKVVIGELNENNRQKHVQKTDNSQNGHKQLVASLRLPIFQNRTQRRLVAFHTSPSDDSPLSIQVPATTHRHLLENDPLCISVDTPLTQPLDTSSSSHNDKTRFESPINNRFCFSSSDNWHLGGCHFYLRKRAFTTSGSLL